MSLGSLEGLKTLKTYREFTVAGHQVVFSFDMTPTDLLKHTSIYVERLGRVTYTSKVAADTYADGLRWLESLEPATARKALEYLWGKVRTK
jgi:hypothetical protein